MRAQRHKRGSPVSPPPCGEGSGVGVDEVKRDHEQRAWALTDSASPRPRIRSRARASRTNLTWSEKKLWWHLRHSPMLRAAHFRRQAVIGGYIADFVSLSSRLVIEVDGGQHAVRIANDETRTRVLNKHGYRVIRFWNNDVMLSIEGVLDDICRAISATTPTPDPSPQGGGE